MMNIYEAHKNEGFQLIIAWSTNFASFDTWYSTTGLGTFTDYYFDDDSSVYSAWTNPLWPSNNYVPKNFLVDRDGDVRMRENVIDEATWDAYVTQLL